MRLAPGELLFQRMNTGTACDAKTPEHIGRRLAEMLVQQKILVGSTNLQKKSLHHGWGTRLKKKKPRPATAELNMAMRRDFVTKGA